MSEESGFSCTVCRDDQLRLLDIIKGIRYWRCCRCEATLMDPAHWLSADQEKAVYDLHDNQGDDPGYCRFLAKLANPLLKKLSPGARGLDFGCGPGPVLAGMLEATGMEMAIYDPLYFPDTSVLDAQYDFITCTEVAEHLHDPLATFTYLEQSLRPGGWLGVMTCFQTDDARFAHWHYRRDPTHVVFYREHTMGWLAQNLGLSLEIPAKDVAIFHKEAR
ncbi:MAG: class I SAM-dependent methyltransferase [Marinobacter sp.]|uniref:class I SAM-dependent methyltransferase n=1 Tax=Marinobacter sp. TaxID=50741 RepID=UPI0034A07CAF